MKRTAILEILEDLKESYNELDELKKVNINLKNDVSELNMSLNKNKDIKKRLEKCSLTYKEHNLEEFDNTNIIINEVDEANKKLLSKIDNINNLININKIKIQDVASCIVCNARSLIK